MGFHSVGDSKCTLPQWEAQEVDIVCFAGPFVQNFLTRSSCGCFFEMNFRIYVHMFICHMFIISLIPESTAIPGTRLFRPWGSKRRRMTSARSPRKSNNNWWRRSVSWRTWIESNQPKIPRSSFWRSQDSRIQRMVSNQILGIGLMSIPDNLKLWCQSSKSFETQCPEFQVKFWFHLNISQDHRVVSYRCRMFLGHWVTDLDKADLDLTQRKTEFEIFSENSSTHTALIWTLCFTWLH